MTRDNQNRVWITVHSALPGHALASILAMLDDGGVTVSVVPEDGYVDIKETDASFFYRVKPEA